MHVFDPVADYSGLRDICPGADVPLSLVLRNVTHSGSLGPLGEPLVAPIQAKTSAISMPTMCFCTHTHGRNALRLVSYFGSGHCGLGLNRSRHQASGTLGVLAGVPATSDLAGGRDEVGQHFGGRGLRFARFLAAGAACWLPVGWTRQVVTAFSVAIEANLDGGERELEHVAFLCSQLLDDGGSFAGRAFLRLQPLFPVANSGPEEV